MECKVGEAHPQDELSNGKTEPMRKSNTATVIPAKRKLVKTMIVETLAHAFKLNGAGSSSISGEATKDMKKKKKKK